MPSYREIVEHTAARFPDLFSDAKANTHQNCANFLVEVCKEMFYYFPDDNWGLLTKSSGENGFTWNNEVRTSHDVIAKPNGERVDIIGDATHESKPASTTWNVISREHWRAHNVWIDYRNFIGMGGSMPEPPAEQPPEEENALGKAFRQIDEIHRFLQRVARIWGIPFP